MSRTARAGTLAAEIAIARASRQRHRRLRFNYALVANFLGLGPVPAEIIDVAGLCQRLKIEREALEKLIASGMPCADINPRALASSEGDGP